MTARDNITPSGLQHTDQKKSTYNAFGASPLAIMILLEQRVNPNSPDNHTLPCLSYIS